MFDEVTQRYGDIRYMDEQRASVIRDVIAAHDLRHLLEIGFFQGKSSTYLAAILEDRGGDGHLTTIDRVSALDKSPGIEDLLGGLGLRHRVSPIWAQRSYTWELGRMIRDGRREVFDFCYFDGGHTWDLTGFGVLLVDMLMKPGGWIVLDDLDWTIDKSVAEHPDRTNAYKKFDEDERQATNVRLVFEAILPHLGYDSFSEHHELHWGMARKPPR